MKTPVTIFLLPVLLFTFSSFFAPDRSITMEKALAEKKIELVIIPLGGHSGNSINIKVKNLTNKQLNIELAPGTVFIPGDTNEQTLVTTREEMLALEKDQGKTFKIYAYCTEASDHCPSTTSTFTISKTTNPTLQKLVVFLDSLKFKDDHAIQQSVWCVTDSQSVSGVYSTDPKTSKAVRGYLCALTGQKDTWYSTRNDVSVGPDRRIISAPKEIKGDIAFESTEAVELQGFVKDSAGTILVTNEHKTNLPAGRIKFEFNLKIAGWKPGNYSVVYTNNGKEVINQPFTIE
jgi:hypothetical protein